MPSDRSLEKKRRREKRKARGAAKRELKPPWAKWSPKREGIEGLAVRARVRWTQAARLAEELAAGERRDARHAVLPSVVRAQATETVLAELARLGVGGVTEEAFVAEAAARRSSRQMAIDLWLPQLPAGAPVSARDYAGQAAEELWARWCPRRVSAEPVVDFLDRAADVALAGHNDEAVMLLGGVVALTLSEGGPDLLVELGLAEDFVSAVALLYTHSADLAVHTAVAVVVGAFAERLVETQPGSERKRRIREVNLLLRGHGREEDAPGLLLELLREYRDVRTVTILNFYLLGPGLRPDEDELLALLAELEKDGAGDPRQLAEAIALTHDILADPLERERYEGGLFGHDDDDDEDPFGDDGVGDEDEHDEGGEG